MKGGERHGVLAIDKPLGRTSFDVLRDVKRGLQQRRVGHAGTLDPDASGVLVVAAGWCTRLVPWLTAADKTYVGTIRLGQTTSSDDAQGEVLQTADVPELDDATIETVLAGFRGAILQVPPQVSAIHVDGQRAHTRVRRGETVQIPARAVVVHRLEVLSREAETITVVAEVSKGTYIRSLARDIGEALGCGGHLCALRRTRSGGWGLDRCLNLESLGRQPIPLYTAWDALAGLPSMEVDSEIARRLSMGHKLAWDPAWHSDSQLPDWENAAHPVTEEEAAVVEPSEPDGDDGATRVWRVCGPAGHLVAVVRAVLDPSGAPIVRVVRAVPPDLLGV